MDKNLQRFREVFFEEAREHLESMEGVLLGLEAGDIPDAETLNGIFRSAHTIKGGSGMFGLDDTARFTHSLENLLDNVRGGKVPITPPLVDVLLRSCDVLRGLLQAAQQGEGAPAGLESVLSALQEANRQGKAPPAAAATPRISALSAEPPFSPAIKVISPEKSRRHWRIRFHPSADVLRRGLDPLLAFRELAELGHITDMLMDTSGVPPLAEMDPETNYAFWTLRLESDQPEARIREAFEFFHEGEGLELRAEVTTTGSLAIEPQRAPAAQPAARADQDKVSNDDVHEVQPRGNQVHMKSVPRHAPEEPRPSAVVHAPVIEAAASSPGAASTTAANETASTIRVDVDLLDRLMNQVGELVLARNQILQFAGATDEASLTAAAQRLDLITSELQEGVMKTRMQPIGVAWSMMPRLVRDLARACGKQIELNMEGAETELDRTIIEAIRDPLTHLVRNACDHGLETAERRAATGKPSTGKLVLGAFHEGGHVIIVITDDGAGIDLARVKSKALERGLISPDQAARMGDREAIQLIYRPGFSTAEKITGVSGRGVGMDVVKTNIERVGGTIDVASNFGSGTSVHIKIPLTLAIIPGMVVEGGGERFVIPQVSLVELVRLEEEQAGERIERIHGALVCRLRGKLLPLAYLNETLELSKTAGENAAARTELDAACEIRSGHRVRPPEQAVNIVVLQAEDRQFGLVVDGIRDTQEIVVKPLGKQLKGLEAYSGATVMGDGRVVLILDVAGLARLAGFDTSQYAGARGAAAAAEAAEKQGPQRQALLLFHAPGFERLAVPLALVSRLEEFPSSRVEQSGGHPVVQYRDRILPLVSLDVLRLGRDASGTERNPFSADPLQVIVFVDGARGLGLVVGEIVDIVEEAVNMRKPSSERGLLGSGVIGGQVTDFLDLRAVIEASGENWTDGARLRTATILVAGASSFTRTLIRSSLEMGGHHVVEAANRADAIEKISLQRFDLVAVAPELEQGSPSDRSGGDTRHDREQARGDGSLIALLRKQAGREIPVLPLGSVLTSDLSQMTASIESLLAQV